MCNARRGRRGVHGDRVASPKRAPILSMEQRRKKKKKRSIGARGGGGRQDEWRSDLKGAADRPTSGGGAFKGSFHLALSLLPSASCLCSPASISFCCGGRVTIGSPRYFLLKCPHLWFSPLDQMPRRTKKRLA